MSISRRKFLGTTSAATAMLLVPQARGIASPFIHVPKESHAGDPDLNALAARAVEAAMAAGASYADVRLSFKESQGFIPGYPSEWRNEKGVGVRVLVNGYWGFLGSAVWTPEEMARLANGAVTQAKAHNRGKARVVDLGPATKVVNGNWSTPIKYDPFDIPDGEKIDFLNAALDFAGSYKVGIRASGTFRFSRQKKVFASSEGSSCTQTLYSADGSFSVSYRPQFHAKLPRGSINADFLSPAGRGWEYITESGLIDAIPRLIDEAEKARYITPVDVGRYDMVFSAQAVAGMLSRTIGVATELDRALGYEADVAGTSYLSPPLDLLGTHQVGSKLLTITANRSMPGGAATVKWDDEGIEPDEYTLVKDGILMDYHTTREQSAWLSSYYQKIGKSVRSHGCLNVEGAIDSPVQHMPNLAMVPGPDDTSFEDLVAGTEKGIAVLSVLGVSMDQQLLNGMGRPIMREIVKGKLGRYIRGGAFPFRSPELWKNLVAVGGASSARSLGLWYYKGQPGHNRTHTTTAVPAKFAQVAVIDMMRKA